MIGLESIPIEYRGPSVFTVIALIVGFGYFRYVYSVEKTLSIERQASLTTSIAALEASVNELTQKSDRRVSGIKECTSSIKREVSSLTAKIEALAGDIKDLRYDYNNLLDKMFEQLRDK